MTNDFDLEAFKFVEKLIEKKIERDEKPEKQTTKLKGFGKIIDLGEVSNFGIEEFDQNTYLTKRKFKDINGKLIGLDTAHYSELKEFVLKIYDDVIFFQDCDFETLLDCSFSWILETYKHQKANSNLLAFLKDEIESLSKEYHFYFQIKALAIEDKIQVGNVEFTFFDEREILQLYENVKEAKPDRTLEEFKSIYKNYFDSVTAFVKVKGVRTRANEKAFRETELAVDLLKLFCCYYSTEKLIQMFEVDYRFTQGSSTQYLQLPNGDIKDSTIQIKNLSGNVPVQLTNDFIQKANAIGLNTFSEFIKNKNETELYYIIIDLIKQLSAIISTHNNYEKTVKSISLFESFCVPKNSGQAKGETILKKKIIPKLFSTKDTETLNGLIRKHYEIRDKYLHNYIQLPLNKKELVMLLEYQRFFILKIIDLNKQFASLSQILAYFDIQ
jgi:hypothetical protein